MPDAVESLVLPPGDLIPHPRNYRQHPDDQVEHLCESIRANGFYKPIVVAEDNVVLAGHGARLAAIKLKLKEVTVSRLPIPSDSPAALKVLAGDNEIGMLADIHDRDLTEILKEVKDAGDDLLGTGFDEENLANLLMATRTSSEIEDFDAAAEWVGMPEYEPKAKVYKLIISCDTQEHLDEVVEKNGLVVWGMTAWWPPKDRIDRASLKFDHDQAAT